MSLYCEWLAGNLTDEEYADAAQAETMEWDDRTMDEEEE